MEGAPLNQFDFYLRFAKPLVLNLAEPNERVLAAAWLQKLRNPDSGDEHLRTDYLKLLLFVLQRKRLAGPFTQNPGQYEKLEQFPEQYKLQDVAKAVIEAEEEDRRKKAAQGKAGASGDYPPYTTEYSADLLEYTAAQDIPNFGVHVYYAISKDPLPLWDNADKGIFPRTLSAGKIDLTRSPSTAASTSTLSGFGARSKSRSRSRSRSRTGTPKTRPSRGKTPPAPPLGVPPPPDERLPPTWGTNLIQVSEPPIYQEVEKTVLEESFPDYVEPLSGELSGDLRFKGPSPQPYVSPFNISAYEPRPYTLRAMKRLDFDEDRTGIQHQPGMDVELQGEMAEDIARISEMLAIDEQRPFLTPALRSTATSVVAPAAPKKPTKKPLLMKQKIKPGKPAPKAKVVAKPALFPPKPAPKYKAPLPPKKKVSKTTVKKITTKDGKTTVEETVTTVQQPAKPKKQQRKGKTQALPPKPQTASPQKAAAAQIEGLEDYDMEELRQLGLTEADLIDIDIDNLDDIQVEDISDQEVKEYEEVAGDLYDEQIMKQLDEYDKRIKELEEEYADDIAMYGDQVGDSPIPGTEEVSPYTHTAFRAPSSGAPSLPYRTPPVSPGFITSPYDDVQYATGMPSFIETSMTEGAHYVSGPILSTSPVGQIGDVYEDISGAQLDQAEAELKQDEADYMQEWLDRFETEEAAAAAISARGKSTTVKQRRPKTSDVRSQTIRGSPTVSSPSATTSQMPPTTIPQMPPMTPSKGAIKKIITKKTSKTKKGIKSVVESTTTIMQPAAPGGQVPSTSSKIPSAGSRIPATGSKLPLPGTAISKTSVPPGSRLPVPPSRITRPAGSKLPQPGQAIKKTTMTTTRVVESTPPLADIGNVSAASLPYRTPPLPYQVHQIDEDLEEYQLMEVEIMKGLSESQRQLEQLEAETKRKDFSRRTEQGQPTAATEAVLDQMEALYSIERGPAVKPLPYQVYKRTEADEGLDEFRAMETNVLGSLSESQRQIERMEAERRRNIATSRIEMAPAQSKASIQAVLAQMEALYAESRMPVGESSPDSPLSQAPSLPYRTPPLPKQVSSTKITSKKVTKTKGGVIIVKESKTIEKPKGPATGSKISFPKRGIPVSRQPMQAKMKTKTAAGKSSTAVSKKPSVKGIKSDKKSEIIAPGTPAAQAIIDEANQQMYKLDQLYKKYQLPDRRADAERTPPVFSKYREIREAGAGISYPPEQFGITEEEPFQPAEEYLKDRKDFSPYVDHRRPMAEVLPGLSTFPEPSDWLLTEEQPDQEIVETVITPIKPSPKQEIEEIIREIEVSPIWVGLPVTTPKRSPSPRRTVPASVSPIMLESPEDKGTTLSKYGMPAVVKRKSPPQYVPGLAPKKPAVPARIPSEPKQIKTEETHTTTTTTQKVPSVGDGELVEIVTTVEETTSVSRQGEPVVVERPTTPTIAGYDEVDEGFADVYSDVYQSPPHLQRTSPKRTPPMSAQRIAALEDVELIPSSPEQVSPQLFDRGGAASLDEMDVDMYRSPTSPQEDNELLSEQIEVTKTEIVEEVDVEHVTEHQKIEQQRILADAITGQRSPYMMVGKTRGKAYSTARTPMQVRSPIKEEIEVEGDDEEEEGEEEEEEGEGEEEAESPDVPFIYVTTVEETELVDEVEGDIIEVPSEQYQSPSQFGRAPDIQLEEEIRPVDYYESPTALPPPPPKPPLPELDPFLVDVAYAEYPEMRKIRPVKRKPRVSPVKEVLEIEPESPTAPRIHTTPRRAGTPSPAQSGTHIRKTRSKRALKRRLIDFSQPEPGTESQRILQVPKAAVREGLPISRSPRIDYLDNLGGMEMPSSYEAPPRLPSPIPVGLPEPVQPVVREQRLPQWQSPQAVIPGRLDVQRQQVQFSPSPQPGLKVDEYISVASAEAPQEIYSSTAQHGYTVPLDTESPGYVVEEEIIEETVEELPATTVPPPPTPPSRWPTPPEPSPDEYTQKAMQAQQTAQQQYESLWSPSPQTPPKQESVWDRQDVEILEAEVPEELAPPGSPPSPFSTTEAMQEMLDTVKGRKYVQPGGRRPVAMYGYGEKTEKVIERKSKPPSLATVPDDRIEPPDDYFYWPGPYQPPVPVTPLKKVLSPKPLHPGHSRSPLYANVPPESAKRRDVVVPSPTRGKLMVNVPPPREPSVALRVPPVLLAEGAIRETPVSRFASRDRRRQQLKGVVSSASPKHEVKMRQATVQEKLDEVKNIMDAVAQQLAALYSPPPPPIKTPTGPRGKRMQHIKKRLFADMQQMEAEAAPTADLPQVVPKSSEIVEIVETEEVIEMPKEYSQYKMETSPRMDHVPDIVDELEYDVEPAEVYYRVEPQVSPVRRPEIRAPTPPAQQPPAVSPTMEYEISDERDVSIYDDDVFEPESPVAYPPSPSEELPSPFISYTPKQSPPGVDPRLKQQLTKHEYTTGLERYERPYQRPFVRVGSRSQYPMGRELPSPELDIVEEEREMWPAWQKQKSPMPVAKLRSLRPKPQIRRRLPSPMQQAKPPSPRMPTPPSPRIPTPSSPKIQTTPQEDYAEQWKSPIQRVKSPVDQAQAAQDVYAKQWKSPVQRVKSPVIQAQAAQEPTQRFTPPILYGEPEEEDVAGTDLEFVRVDTEESVSFVDDSPEFAPDPGYHHESPTTERLPSPYLSYTPPLPQPRVSRQRYPSPQSLYSGEELPSPYLRSYTPPLPRPSVRKQKPAPPENIYSEGVPEAVQRKSPIWPQFSKEETSARPTAEQMMAAPSRSVQETEQATRSRRLKFDTYQPPVSPPRPQVPPPKIGIWITPPPTSSKATPPILQKRPEFVSPPSEALLASLFTPPEGRRVSPQRPIMRTSPLPPPTTPWLPQPSATSLEMEVVESTTTTTTIVAPETDYEVRQPFGGSRSPGIYDTSPMRLDLERSFIEDELKGFKWMDQ